MPRTVGGTKYLAAVNVRSFTGWDTVEMDLVYESEDKNDLYIVSRSLPLGHSAPKRIAMYVHTLHEHGAAEVEPWLGTAIGWQARITWRPH
jgi:hypothetical protein